MAVRRMPDDAPEEFLVGVESLRAARIRPEILLEEIPAPQRVAPYASAWSAEVIHDDTELSSGQFVLLYDASEPDTWSGAFRVVTLSRATLEPDVGNDPLIGQIGWTWLQECLEAEQAHHIATGGTVTRVVSESYGSLSENPPTIEIQLRASWTPVNELERHVLAWTSLLCTIAGLPPLPPGVTALPRRP